MGTMKYETLGAGIGRLVDEKNESYGDSVRTSAEALKLLFPDGVPVDRYGDVLLLVRIWDKMMRIANRKDAFGEDPFADIAGYGIRGAGDYPSILEPDPAPYRSIQDYECLDPRSDIRVPGCKCPECGF